MWIRLGRLVLVVVVAAVMAGVGSVLVFGPQSLGQSVDLMAFSAVLWLALSPLIAGQSLGMAVSVGLLSPLIAVAPFAPMLAFSMAFSPRAWLALPTGMATGILVRASLSIGRGSGDRQKRNST